MADYAFLRTNRLIMCMKNTKRPLFALICLFFTVKAAGLHLQTIFHGGFLPEVFERVRTAPPHPATPSGLTMPPLL